jgi:tetratricopeptide (TPR) repeat protein
LSRIARTQGEFEEAEKLACEGCRLFEQLNDDLGAAAALNCLGHALYVQDRLEEAEQFFRQSLEINERHGIRHGIAWNKSALAGLEERRGNPEKALLLAEEAYELHQKLGMQRERDQTQELLDRLQKALSADPNA